MLNEDFLLKSRISKELYHQVACKLPIVDYHNHLNPEAMASNKKFRNITELWIYDDQYKHRLMRIHGVEEQFITGNAPDYEKFLAWMKIFPKTIGNPLYHWSQIEIKYIFGSQINLFEDEPLAIWEACNKQLGEQGLGVIDILKKWNTEILSTSDDLLDDLQNHKAITDKKEDGISVFPSLRSDSVIAFQAPGFLKWLGRLEELTGTTVHNLSDYEEAIKLRLNYFQDAGCALSDHALDSSFTYKLPSRSEAIAIFKKRLNEEYLNERELTALKSYVFKFLGVEYGKRKLVMQLHIGAQRVTSSRLKAIASKFGGFATIGDTLNIQSLCEFLDDLECEQALPSTILYTLNAADNDRVATLTGSFTEEGVSGKIQFGPAWWFNDHYDGIVKQITAISSFGQLDTFIGMTSDSRSFLSLSRHYYFRRILCHLLGEWVEKGLLSDNFEILAALVTKVCYANAKHLIIAAN
ncbi:glucuronate isomerase [Pedobacter sp. CG_S7]|uniref:glucuronate isomerase n=1 Tax=Pedobacter sp. CG_S7 TaxID=3143930 RepID=UPI00339970D6